MEWIGWLSSLCFICCYIPQLYKTYKYQSVEDVSLGMWLLLGIGCATGMDYAYKLESYPLLINYGIGFICVWIWLIMYSVYRDPDKAYIKKILKDIKKELK